MADEKQKQKQPQNDTELLSELKEKFTRAETARKPFETQWKLNLYWLVGRQYTVIHDYQSRVVEPKAPPWRVRLVANRILPIWRGSLGRLLKTRPIPDVIPSTGEEEDVLTAKVADKVIKYVWYNRGLEGQKSIELYGWMLACGSSFLMPHWDPEAGEMAPVEEPLDEDPDGDEEAIDEVVEELGGEKVEKEPRMEPIGDIMVSVVSPFEVFPENGIHSLDEMSWVFVARSVPVKDLKSRYPLHADDIHEEEGLENIEWPFGSPASPTSYNENLTPSQESRKGVARIVEYFQKPSSDFPKGRHVVYVGDTLIKRMDKLPFNHKRIPIVKFDNIIYPGRFWGGSVIEQLIPLQREYNRARSMLIETRNMMSRPKLLIPIQAGVAEDQWTTEPGEKIFYNPIGGGRPEPWVPPPVPGYVLQELDRIEQDMMEVASHHWATRGLNPPGVRTAAGIAMLQEADDTPFGPVLLWNESSWRQVAEQIVELAKEFYGEPRQVYMHVGNEAEIAEFNAESLQGRYRIRVDVGSSLPMSKAARIQFGLELLDRGAFRDANNKINESKFFEFLEMNSAVEIVNEDGIDIRIARLENVDMRDRQRDFEAGEYDNHTVHLMYHKKFMKELNMENPGHPAVQLLNDHIKQHELRMRQLQLKQAEEQIQLQAAVEEIKNAVRTELTQNQPTPPQQPGAPTQPGMEPAQPGPPQGPDMAPQGPVPPGPATGAAPPPADMAAMQAAMEQMSQQPPVQ